MKENAKEGGKVAKEGRRRRRRLQEGRRRRRRLQEGRRRRRLQEGRRRRRRVTRMMNARDGYILFLTMLLGCWSCFGGFRGSMSYRGSSILDSRFKCGAD